MAKRVVTKSIEIDASVNAVWHALIDPESIRQYFYGTNVVSDWKAGGTLRFTGTWQGKDYEDKGVILEIIPNQILQYTYWSPLTGVEDKPENHAVVTYELEAIGTRTRVKVSQANSPTEAMQEHSESGWLEVLNSLKQFLEKSTVNN